MRVMQSLAPGQRVFLKVYNCQEGIFEFVAGHHLQCHLAYPPGLLAQRSLYRLKRHVIPGLEQSVSRPDAQPVGGQGGSPVTTQRAGGPPRARVSAASASPPLSDSMQPATTAFFPRLAHCCSMLSRRDLPAGWRSVHPVKDRPPPAPLQLPKTRADRHVRGSLRGRREQRSDVAGRRTSTKPDSAR
jgi:hypothetical protein